MCRGDNGNIYMTGFVSDGSFAGTPLDVYGSQDIFLAKFSSSGTLRWVVTAGGPASIQSETNDGAGYVVYDSTSNAVYISGGFSGPAVFGPGITATGDGSFIAKYDTAGTCLWANTTEGGTGRSLGLDASGCVYLYCWSNGDVGTLIYQGTPNIPVANGPSLGKYSNTGQLLWAKSLGHNIDGIIQVRADRLYFIGRTFITDCNLLGDPILHNASLGVSVLAALDTSSTQIFWRTTFLSSVVSSFLDASFANDSTLLIVGFFRDSLFLADDTLTASNAETRPFCTVIDTSGVTRSVNAIEANVTSARVSAALDGSFYQLMRFSGALVLPNTTLTASSTGDMAIVRCQSDGTPIGVLQCGPVETAMDVLATSDSGVAVCGRFLASVDLGGGVSYTGNNDAFIAKYDVITAISTMPLQQGALRIYANPNRGVCTIDLPDQLRLSDDLMLSIVDQTGQLVQRIPVRYTPQGVAIDIRAQAKGIYHVEISDGKQRYTGTIVFE